MHLCFCKNMNYNIKLVLKTVWCGRHFIIIIYLIMFMQLSCRLPQEYCSQKWSVSKQMKIFWNYSPYKDTNLKRSNMKIENKKINLNLGLLKFPSHLWKNNVRYLFHAIFFFFNRFFSLDTRAKPERKLELVDSEKLDQTIQPSSSKNSSSSKKSKLQSPLDVSGNSSIFSPSSRLDSSASVTPIVCQRKFPGPAGLLPKRVSIVN